MAPILPYLVAALMEISIKFRLTGTIGYSFRPYSSGNQTRQAFSGLHAFAAEA